MAALNRRQRLKENNCSVLTLDKHFNDIHGVAGIDQNLPLEFESMLN